MTIAGIITIIMSSLASIISALVLYNLNTISKRQDIADAKMERFELSLADIKKEQAVCKIDCGREFVSAESYVRSEAYNRNKIDKIDNNMATLLGQMEYIKQIPEASAQIAGNVARQIIQELQRNPK